MKLCFVTNGYHHKQLPDKSWERRQNTGALGTFKKVEFEDLKLFVKKFEKAWVSV